jgi:hypothetical protein
VFFELVTAALRESVNQFLRYSQSSQRSKKETAQESHGSFMKIPQFFHENCSFIELSLNPIGNEGVVVLFFFLWAKKPEPGVINQIKYPHNTV